MTDYEVICPYCGKQAELVDSIRIYIIKSYGRAYLCEPCWAYVGCHKGTTKPLGKLADAELRGERIKVHKAFDGYWRGQEMSRSLAYRWLAEQLGISMKKCHVGMFDLGMCELALEALREYDT